LFIQDVSGFMVGSRSEHGGIIKDGAKLVNVMSNSVVPKLTLYVGNSFGAGNYAMCGKAYDPRFLFAWPTAQVAVMSGAAAANTLLQIEKATLHAKGKTIDPDTEKTMFQTIKARYDRQTSPYYAAARLWIDELILPSETRTMISMGLEAADHAPVTRAFNPGVLQT
jgi:acetyl-CoA carboxylase carboxyltransferase component